MNKEEKNIKQVPIWLSLVPLIILITLLIATIHGFGSDSLSGATQVVLLATSAISCIIGMAYAKVSWHKIENQIISNISSVATSIIILLLIGALGGAWMISGVVPTLIYYGVGIIDPNIFLATSCVISALVSVMTGSSWTTIATIGVALVGIGKAQGFDEGWIAGAIISGAYFGDKISPLSDTTVLASSSCGVNIFDHIRYMLITTVPSITIALIIFLIIGFQTEGFQASELSSFRQSIANSFNISGWLMIVPIVTGIMIAKRLPAIVTLFASSSLGVIFALIFQKPIVDQIADGNLYVGILRSLYDTITVPTESEMLSELVTTRGMSGMLSTIWLILCAACFGATLTASGMTDGITRLFAKISRGRVSTVASTVSSGVILNTATSDQYISILLTGSVFRNIYKRNGLEYRLLSRATEDSATVVSVLIPWNTCGMVQSTVLGVATLTYLPYCFFNLISPLMSIFIATIGYKIFKRKDTE